MIALWKHEEVLPLVGDIILRLCRQKQGRWVPHDEIVDEILRDPELDMKIEHAVLRGGKDKRWWAANMLAWFSQRYTEYERGGLTPGGPVFIAIEEAYTLLERERVGREAYNYRLRVEPAPKITQRYQRKRTKHVPEELLEKQKEFAKFVKELKAKKSRGEITAEDYRRLVVEWGKQWEERRRELTRSS